MPRYPARPLPDGWQIVRRAEGYFLQRRTGPRTWEDIAGPYTQRWSAQLRAERMAAQETTAERR